LTGPFLGSTSDLTRQQLRARRFRRLHRDVFLPSTALDDLDARCRALLLALPDAVPSHTTAAALWRLPARRDDLLHVTRDPAAAVSRRPAARTHRARLAPGDRDEVRGLAVTSLERTFVDLAATHALEQLVAVGDVVLRRSSRDALERAVGRAGRRKGVVLARAALALLDPGAASPAESRCRLLLHAAGWTGLRHAVPIHDRAGEWVAEADLGDVEARVAVQYDGLVHFAGADAAQRISDVARDELARAAGWEVVVLTARDLRHPHLALQKVAAAYDRASRRRLGAAAA
jgi:hypothetical protein